MIEDIALNKVFYELSEWGCSYLQEAKKNQGFSEEEFLIKMSNVADEVKNLLVNSSSGSEGIEDFSEKNVEAIIQSVQKRVEGLSQKSDINSDSFLSSRYKKYLKIKKEIKELEQTVESTGQDMKQMLSRVLDTWEQSPDFWLMHVRFLYEKEKRKTPEKNDLKEWIKSLPVLSNIEEKNESEIRKLEDSFHFKVLSILEKADDINDILRIVKNAFHLDERSTLDNLTIMQSTGVEGKIGLNFVIQSPNGLGDSSILGGFVGVVPTADDPQTCYGNMMAISDSLQNMGIGKKLFKGMAEILLGKSVKYVTATVPIFKMNSLLNIVSLGGEVSSIISRPQELMQGSIMDTKDRIDRYYICWDLEKIEKGESGGKISDEEVANSDNILIVQDIIEGLKDITLDELKGYPNEREKFLPFEEAIKKSVAKYIDENKMFMFKVPSNTTMEDNGFGEESRMKVELGVKILLDTIFEKDKLKEEKKEGYVINGCRLVDNGENLLYRCEYKEKKTEIPFYVENLKENEIFKLNHLDSNAPRDKRRDFFDKYYPLTVNGVENGREMEYFLNDKETLFFVSGNPGAGKSTYSKYLSLLCMHQYEKYKKVPIRIDLSYVSSVADLEEEITEYLNGKIPESENFVYFFDGFDELKCKTDEDRYNIVRRIEELSKEHKCIVFGRTAGEFQKNYKSPSLGKHLEVQSFNEQEESAFVYRYFGVDERNLSKRSDKEETANDRKNAKKVCELLRMNFDSLGNDSFLVELLCFQVDNNKSGDYLKHPVVISLYKNTIGMFLSQEITKNVSHLDPIIQKRKKTTKKLLKFIAGNDIKNEKELKKHPDFKGNLDNLKYAKAILRQKDGSFDFIHETFKEYLKASYYKKNPEKFLADMEWKQNSEHWTEDIHYWIYYYLLMHEKKDESKKWTKEIVEYYMFIEKMFCSNDKQIPSEFKKLFHEWRDELYTNENLFSDAEEFVKKIREWRKKEPHGFIWGIREYEHFKENENLQFQGEVSYELFTREWLNLKNLVFGGGRMQKEGMDIFANHSYCFPELSFLNLQTHDFSDDDIQEFIRNIYLFPELMSVDLPHNNLTDATIDLLTQEREERIRMFYLEEKSKLKLDISWKKLNERQLYIVRNAYSRGDPMIRFAFGDNPGISLQGMMKYIKYFFSNSERNLYLDLEKMAFSNKEFEGIMNIIPPGRISGLNIERNPKMGDATLDRIVENRDVFKELSMINLSPEDFSYNGMMRFLEKCSQLESLEYLYVNDCFERIKLRTLSSSLSVLEKYSDMRIINYRVIRPLIHEKILTKSGCLITILWIC